MEYQEERNQNDMIMQMLNQQNQQQMHMQRQMLTIVKVIPEKKQIVSNKIRYFISCLKFWL